MRNVNLEENELTITAIFQQHTKEETIQTLKEALEVLEQEESDPENDEIIEFINSTDGKLQQIAEHRLAMAPSKGYGISRIPAALAVTITLDAVTIGAFAALQGAEVYYEKRM